MKKRSFVIYSVLFASFLAFIGCSQQDTTTLMVTNTSELDRTDAPVSITREKLVQKTGEIPSGKIPLFIFDDGTPIPQQQDDLDGDGEWDEIAFVIDIPAQSQTPLSVTYVSPDEIPSFTARTNVRMGVLRDSAVVAVDRLTLDADELPVQLKFQMDGPAWENDKIGFRHYIDGRNARDFFGKKSPEMALDTVGISSEGLVQDTYHVMRDWGRDILSVGNSLGAGGLAILHNDEPIRLGITFDDERNNIETTTYRLIKKGPVRSIFELKYEDWHVGDQSYDLTNTVTIWAGQHWFKNDIIFHSPQPSDTLIVGLVNSNNDEPLLPTDPIEGLVPIATHDQQNYDRDQYLGLALLLPESNYIEYVTAPDIGTGITTSFNALLEVKNETSISFYTLGAWELADSNFTDRNYFQQFLTTNARKISNPVSLE
ncbi:DUF4861 domain-containing protein [Rhodohalobacter sp. 614A]|uniref:DUF4861 domain-containing protein n=1 Tax=Rhodohalobacter sp. 614A TaxID=2908649 RepID=UPI001F33878D|nr:DUF4861 domain-containing protein [Rhodohalobacter sp. 614A]